MTDFRSHSLYPRWSELAELLLTTDGTAEQKREWLEIDAQLRKDGAFPSKEFV